MARLSVAELRALQSTLNSSIESYISSVDEKDSNSRKTRDAAITGIAKASSTLRDAVSDPFGHVIGIALQPTINLAIRVALDLELFSLIDEKTSLDELTQKTGAEKRLLFRVIRLLVAAHILTEPEEKVYSNTIFSNILTLPSFRDWHKTNFDTLAPIWLRTPNFLARNGYNDVTDLTNNPTVDLYGMGFFEQLAKDSRREVDFASAMKMQDQIPPNAWPRFPFEDGASNFTSNSQEVFLVDIGGGNGQYLERVHKSHPSLPGRNVLQDIPSVLAVVSKEFQINNNFYTMEHDFFKPQPIHGARYYHLRGILHDWPDSSCIEILNQLRSAFRQGYSKLLINTYVLPEMGCKQREAMMDINMITCCGTERTMREFHELLAKAGFKIVRTVKADLGPYMTIEADLLDSNDRAKI